MVSSLLPIVIKQLQRGSTASEHYISVFSRLYFLFNFDNDTSEK